MKTALSSLVLLLTALFASGCDVTVTCEEIPCRHGYVCNIDTGECEKKVSDCRVEDTCRANELCDPESGQCRPQQLRCTDSGACPSGQVCNTQSGFCEPASRCTVDGCRAGQQCNELTEQCEPQSCGPDLDECPASFVCGDEGRCVEGCIAGAGDCPPQQFCRVLTGQALGQCVPNCRTDQECPFGQFCDLSAQESRCEYEGPCTRDGDCRTDEVCDDGACRQPPCTSNEDCLASQLCRLATGRCIEVDCAEDVYGRGELGEPNDTMATAYPLQGATSIELTQLSLCPGSSDWFALPVRSTDIVRVRLRQLSELPDLDLYVYDEHGVPLVANEQLGTITSLKFAPGREQMIFIEIRTQAYVAAQYDLSISTEFCQNDAFEENDSMGEATIVPSTIGTPSDLPLRSCGFDEDWFRLKDLQADEGLRVERLGGSPDLTVELYTPDGETISVSRDQAFEALRVGADGDYFVRAQAVLGQTGEYRLLFESREPYACPNAGANELAEAAIPVSLDTPQMEHFCPTGTAWEVEWLSLEPMDGPGTIDVAIVPQGGVPRLQAVLLEENDQGERQIVRAGVDLGDQIRLAAEVDQTNSYYVRLSASAPVGRLMSPPRYEISYTFSPR